MSRPQFGWYAALSPRPALAMPSNIQYVWPHPSRRTLYVSTSDSASGNATVPGKVHRLCAVRINADGSLQMHGEAQVLAARPIHNSVDASGRFALAPSERIERWLMAWDHRWFGDPPATFAAWPRAVRWTLEVLYMACFVLLPAGALVLWWLGRTDALDRYWAIVVATEFGINARHGGLDSRAFPGAQTAHEVAVVIADALARGDVDVYTRPEGRATVARYFAAEDLREAEAGFGPPRR